MNRRQLLRGAGAFGGGMVAAGLFDYASHTVSTGGTDQQFSSLAPSVTVRAASPSGSDAGQPLGGPWNKAFQASTESPVAITDKKATLFPDEKMYYAPVIDQNGNVLATNRDPGIAVVGDITTQSEINKIDLEGNLANPGMFHDENIIVGTATALQKVNPSTGNTIETINQDSRADILKNGNYGFTAKAGGMEKFALEDFENNTALEMPNNPAVYETTAIKNGDILPMIGGTGLSAYDTNNGEIMDTIDINMSEGSSTDTDYLYGRTSIEKDLIAAEIPKNSEESWSIKDKIRIGETVGFPIVVDDSGADVWLYGANTSNDDGNSPVKAYTFDGNSFTEKWTTEVPGVAASLSKVGDTVIRGGDGLYLLDGTTGEIIAQQEDAVGRVNIMYQDLLAYNDPNDGGIHIYQLEMEDVGGDPSPNIDLSFSGLPADPVTQGTTTEFDFAIQNSGDGEFIGDVVFEYTAGDAADTYTDSITETVASETTLTIDHEYTPGVFGDSSFSFEYDAATDTITVTVPVEIDGDQTEANITGSSSTS